LSIKVKANGGTHVGQVRSNNQDAFLIEQPKQLYIVADGMGGHAGGEIASQLCVEEVSNYLNMQESQGVFKSLVHPDARINTAMANSVNYASTKIYEKALEDPSLKGMGTTATVCKVIDDTAYVAHVGDSRLYLLRCGLLYQMTHDHSLVSEQVRAGILSKEEAEAHHLRNVITRSVGYQEEEDVDTTSFQVEDGDLILICSDGLHGPVNDNELSEELQKSQLDSTDGLIEKANSRGGEDNITTVVVQIKV
jgi:serine/threonine protein phosphatase PrpC